MTNEEMQAKIASVKSFDDAYKMAREGGYKGTAEEFVALVKQAADEIMPMDMDAMENVAGGFGLEDVKNGFSSAADYVSNACSGAVNWVKQNPALTAEIAGGVALVGVAVGTSVVAWKSYSAYKKTEAEVYNSDKINIPGADPGRMWFQDHKTGQLKGWQDYDHRTLII